MDKHVVLAILSSLLISVIKGFDLVDKHVVLATLRSLLISVVKDFAQWTSRLSLQHSNLC